MKVKNLPSCVDPLLLYITAAYLLGRVYQLIFNEKSVWQAAWEKIQDLLGKKLINCRGKDT